MKRKQSGCAHTEEQENAFHVEQRSGNGGGVVNYEGRLLHLLRKSPQTAVVREGLQDDERGDETTLDCNQRITCVVTPNFRKPFQSKLRSPCSERASRG